MIEKSTNISFCAWHWGYVSSEGETRFETEPEATRHYSVYNQSSRQMYKIVRGVLCFHECLAKMRVLSYQE